jgi:hypothetical protein
MSDNTSLDTTCINTIRTLSMDASKRPIREAMFDESDGQQ